MKSYVVSTADWSKTIDLEELDSVDSTIFEASTRAVEWALNSGQEVGIFIYLRDPEQGNKDFVTLTYKVLVNAGYHQLADLQREIVQQDFGIDIREEPLNKLIHKLQKAALKKFFCIAKLTKVQVENRVSKIPIVCINLGLFEDRKEAMQKCKELNKSAEEKIFVVKKIMHNL